MDTNEKTVKPKFPRLLRASIVFTVIGLLSLCPVALSWVTEAGFLSLVYYLVLFPALAISCLALLFGVIYIAICVSKKEKLNRNRWVSFSCIFLSLTTILILCLFLMDFYPMYDKEICLIKLRNITFATLDYLDDNREYPAADKWCDLIVEYTKNNPYRYGKGVGGNLTCPGAKEGRGHKEGRSHFAINPNVTLDSSPDTVLLFECKGGWNRFGGPEILTLENHEGEGCSIAFCDGRTKFVNKNQINELKW